MGLQFDKSVDDLRNKSYLDILTPRSASACWELGVAIPPYFRRWSNMDVLHRDIINIKYHFVMRQGKWDFALAVSFVPGNTVKFELLQNALESTPDYEEYFLWNLKHVKNIPENADKVRVLIQPHNWDKLKKAYLNQKPETAKWLQDYLGVTPRSMDRIEQLNSTELEIPGA